MRKKSPPVATTAPEQEVLKSDGNRHLKLGVSVGVLGAGAAAIGAVCPLCVVVCPAFIASGLWKHHQAKQQRACLSAPDPEGE